MLLGIKGCFEFFEISFDAAEKLVVWKSNSNLNPIAEPTMEYWETLKRLTQ